MGLILNIETTTTNCSVSLGDNGELIHVVEDNNQDYSHGESLHLFIEKALKDASLSKDSLSAIAVSEGPGSYTGLRIGVSAAKGLCYALDIPLIAINTLQSLAYQATINSGFIIPMLDARRMEVYSAVYDHNHQNIRGIEAQIIDEHSFESYLKDDTVYFIGNSNEKVKDVLKSPNAKFLDFVLPSSKQMAKLSYQHFKQGKFEDLAYFKPFYLKKFKTG